MNGLGRDCRLPARARQIIKRGHRAKGQGSFDAALNGLMVHPDGPGYRKKGSVLPVGEQHSRRLAGSVRDRVTAVNLVTSSSLSANSIACRHPAMISLLACESKQRGYNPCQQK